MVKTYFIWLIFIVFFLAVIGSGYYFFNKPNYQIFSFSGEITAINGEEITLNGAYDPAPGIPEILLAQRNLVIRVSEATKFNKEIIQWPTAEQITARDGVFNIQDLPKQKDAGLLDDLKNQFNTENKVFVQATFSESIVNAKKPIASRIYYRVLSGFSGSN